jgi:hypothetical protein
VLHHKQRRSVSRVWLFAAATALSLGCCALSPYRTPEGIERWQEPSPPTLSLAAKAARFQAAVEERFQTREGLIHYRRRLDRRRPEAEEPLADGCFHTGIYLASQSLRYAVTKDPAARAQVLRSLNALRLLMELTGRRGLLGRHFAFAPSAAKVDERWRRSLAHPDYLWRGDVSKDQYAGFIHGLGVAWAVVDDAAVRARAAELAAAAADHLIANDLAIVDANDRRATHGDLSGHWLCVPIGVNALIALAVAKVAEASSAEPRHLEFYRGLVGDGYPEASYWAHFSFLGIGSAVNDHMAYLALYPLLLIERDAAVLAALRESERRSWRALSEDRNAFFAFVHAALAADDPGDSGRSPSGLRSDAAERGRQALREFPADKVEWPVDLTREGFDFPRAFLNSRRCMPRTTQGVPLHLRPRTSSFWAAEPDELAGNLSSRGDVETAGVDYLLAYWMGRYHGLLSEGE